MRLSRPLGVLVMAFLAVTAFALGEQSGHVKKPGDQPFTPTRLEWAALELSARYGQFPTPDFELGVTFIPGNDGHTIHCLLAYGSDFPAAVVRDQKAALEKAIDTLRRQRGWTWLVLKY